MRKKATLARVLTTGEKLKVCSISKLMIGILLLSILAVGPVISVASGDEIVPRRDAIPNRDSGRSTTQIENRIPVTPPSGRQIVVDGYPDDWAGMSPIVSDAWYDPVESYCDYDIHDVYVTDDGTYLYLMMELDCIGTTNIYFDLDVDQNIDTGYNTNTDIWDWYINPHDTGIDYWIFVDLEYPTVVAELDQVTADGDVTPITTVPGAAEIVVETCVLLSDIGEPAPPEINMDFQTYYYIPEDEAPDIGCVTYSPVAAAEILWDDTHDTDEDDLYTTYSTLYSSLIAKGYTVVQLNETQGPISSTILADYDILVIPDPEAALSASEITAIQNFVSAGGRLWVIGERPATFNRESVNTLLAPYEIAFGTADFNGNVTNFATHPITSGVSWFTYIYGSNVNVWDIAQQIAWYDAYGVLAVWDDFSRVVAIGDSNLFDDEYVQGDNQQLGLNIVNWLAARSLEPDIRVDPMHLDFYAQTCTSTPTCPSENCCCPCDNRTAYPIMQPDSETLQEWMELYNSAPLAHMYPGLVPPTGSYSLLDHLDYTPSERNQGSCGNCWVWAGTGVMEIALDVQEGTKDRLSIQYLNSKYNGGTGSNWACCGGWLEDLAGFYASEGFTIPWSNTNAAWADGTQACTDSTTVPWETIGTSPNYPITECTTESIPTHDVGQTTAINNIKNVLAQDRAIWFGFFLPTGDDWDQFFDFWDYESEDVIWNPDYSCGHSWDNGGGHAVLCVGYDDTDPDNSYWIMLNSWGTASGGRPNGIFHLDMDMNYDCWYEYSGSNYYSFYWQTLDITFELGCQPVMIYNDGNADLEVTAIQCDQPWLSVSPLCPPSFTVSPGESQTVSVCVDPTGLDVGVYYGNVRIYSNDPDENLVTVTVTLYVERIQCTVTFYTDPSTIGSITFEGKTYTNDQSDSFDCGTSGPATASAPSCWTFDHWETTGNVQVSSTTTNPTTVTINCGGTLTAVFKKITYELTIQVSGTGTTDPSPGTYTYDCCTEVTVTAIETDPCWVFDHWELDGEPAGSANPILVHMDNNLTLHAVFVPTGIHDVAVTNVTSSKTVVGQGYSLNINVTVANQGDFTETFNITAYYNETAITLPNGKNHTTITLTSGNSTTITLTWNTTGVAKGNYTITAYAHPVPGETDTDNNTKYAEDEVCVSIPGDLDADFDVDLYDAVKLLVIYGAKKGQPEYDPNCDIDGDGDIDLYDAVILLTHYGQKDP